jgi:hypothetical protein
MDQVVEEVTDKRLQDLVDLQELGSAATWPSNWNYAAAVRHLGAVRKSRASEGAPNRPEPKRAKTAEGGSGISGCAVDVQMNTFGAAPSDAVVREGAACTPRRGLTTRMSAAELESVRPGCVVPVHSKRPPVDADVQLDIGGGSGSHPSSTGSISADRLSSGRENATIPTGMRLRPEDAASFGAELQRAITVKPSRAGERQLQAKRKRIKEAEVRERPIMELDNDAPMTDAQLRTARLLAKVRKKNQDS